MSSVFILHALQWHTTFVHMKMLVYCWVSLDLKL